MPWAGLQKARRPQIRKGRVEAGLERERHDDQCVRECGDLAARGVEGECEEGESRAARHHGRAVAQPPMAFNGSSARSFLRKGPFKSHSAGMRSSVNGATGTPSGGW